MGGEFEEQKLVFRFWDTGVCVSLQEADESLLAIFGKMKLEEANAGLDSNLNE